MKLIHDSSWLERLNTIDFAFQPIVNIHTGVCYGCEALLRNYQEAGFESINHFFDEVYAENILYSVDLMLREKAIIKLSQLKWDHQVKLFFNLDNRVLNTKDYKPGNTMAILNKYKLSQDTICFELSEKHELPESQESISTLKRYREQGFKIAVDDCGAGFSGLKLLYFTRPNFIKVDRFFIRDISSDPNKRLFVATIVNLAHLMGSLVVAEGVETLQEYYSCKDIGCDLIQGYFVQPPQLDIQHIQPQYLHIQKIGQQEQRDLKSKDKKLIDEEITYIPPISHKSNMIQVLDLFKKNPNLTFLPVVNDNYEALGIINEKSFKDYTYSRYGNDLLQNPSFGKNLFRFIDKYPMADIRTSVEKILEIYSQNENIEGILIVEDLKYKGFLSAHSLLKVLNEKNIAMARDQNPLTHLPGNSLIHEYLSHALQDIKTQYVLVYFDFNHFKPFNDVYGFRNGDRVIQRFSELLKTKKLFMDCFIGHIGGDDFFMGVKQVNIIKIQKEVKQLIEQFKIDAESFYDPQTREKGFIEAVGRDGKSQKFPLLSVSAVIVELSDHRTVVYPTEHISRLMAKGKTKAKNNPQNFYILRIDPNQDSIDLDKAA